MNQGERMKNHNPAGRNLSFASTGQRLVVTVVFVVFAALIWAAWTGRYDREINTFASWLQRQYNAIAH